MGPAGWVKRVVLEQLNRSGYDLRKRSRDSPGQRRAQMLRTCCVDLVIDVGANVGQYGRELREFGYNGHIRSFEPLSSAYAKLQASSGADNDWVVERVAVGDRSGELQLHVAGNSVSSSALPMLGRHEAAAPESRYVAEETVTVSTLDALVGSDVASAKSPFVKIDTQGYERAVLEGATEVIERAVGVELELSLIPLYEGQPLMFDLIDWMSGAGLRLAGVEKGFWDITSGETLQLDAIFLRT